jgi:alkanesulfonate monooxygenase SsuD/methylene tetrahydromethanopterin reductase-like flavin-dependent oxidoreductase (luciferase family)
VITGVPVAIGDDAEPLLDFVRPALALYIGGMGARGKNFYNDLAVRYGYEAEAKTIQDLYLDGKKDEAAAAVPEELVRAASLIGPESYVAERIAAFAEAGVSTLMLQPLDGTREGRLKTVETMKRLGS